MHTTVLSSKGQIIIPKALRVARRWGPGTQLEVHDTPEGVLLRPATVAQIEATAHGGERMPPKTTFFHPKLKTGLVFRDLG